MARRPLVLAHRGASAAERENTVAAFATASRMGADGVELDVRRTADGVLVVHHDAHAPEVGLLLEVPFESVEQEAPHVPTLEAVLDVLGDLLVNIEVKCLPWEPDPDPDGVVVRAVVELVQRRGIVSSVVVSSFDLGAIDTVRALDPTIPTGWLVHGRAAADFAPIAQEHGHPWLHPDRASVLADPAAAVRAARDYGLRLDVWTVDDPFELRVLSDAGVDAIITNVPDVALAALA